MAQTRAGALKAAAKMAGIPASEYYQKIIAGYKLCQVCRSWQPRSAYYIDRSRFDGLSKRCSSCRLMKVRKDRTGIPSGRKGAKFSPEVRARMKAAALDSWAKGRVHHYQGKKRPLKDRLAMSVGQRALQRRGASAAGYRDGLGLLRAAERQSAEYGRWRFDVFMRDSFTCQHCGDSRGRNLQAHHIKPFASHPELRTDITNGITLCWDCHDKQHACRVGRRRTKPRFVEPCPHVQIDFFDRKL